MCLCASDDMMREVTREMTVQRVQSLISQYIHLKEEMQKNAKQNVPGIENWAKMHWAHEGQSSTTVVQSSRECME